MDYIKFIFTSVKNKSKSLNHVVLAEKMEDLQMFLAQHRFDRVPKEAITMLPEEKFKPSYEMCILKPYKFWSNSSKEVFTIMTCEDLLDSLVDNLASDLSRCLLFGEAIIRRDIEVFREIGDIISELSCAHVIDFSYIDLDPSSESECIQSQKDAIINTQRYLNNCGSCPTEDPDIKCIWDDIWSGFYDGVVTTVTVEAYISNFIETMTDSFT